MHNSTWLFCRWFSDSCRSSRVCWYVKIVTILLFLITIYTKLNVYQYTKSFNQSRDQILKQAGLVNHTKTITVKFEYHYILCLIKYYTIKKMHSRDITVLGVLLWFNIACALQLVSVLSLIYYWYGPYTLVDNFKSFGVYTSLLTHLRAQYLPDATLHSRAWVQLCLQLCVFKNLLRSELDTCVDCKSLALDWRAVSWLKILLK